MDPVTEPRRTFEHLWLTGVFVPQPQFLITILWRGRELGTFGVHAASRTEVEDGIWFRAVQLLPPGPIEEELGNCQARVTWEELECWFTYDKNKHLFQER